MDFQNRPGGKTGSGGVASWSDANRDRRERLRQLALETIDLNKDPYFMKNHLGKFSVVLNTLAFHNKHIIIDYIYFSHLKLTLYSILVKNKLSYSTF